MEEPNITSAKKLKVPHFGVFIIIFGLILFVMGARAVYRTYSPNYVGIRTEAVVLGKEIKENKKQYFYFDYSFEDIYGKIHKGRDSVSRPLFSSKNEGENFTIFYLSDKPEIRYIPGSASTMWAAVVMSLGFAITFASSIGFSVYWRTMKESREMQKSENS